MNHIFGPTMGTTYNIKYFPEDGTPKREAIALRIENLLKSINDEMSTYQKNSEISYFNHQQKPHEWIKISESFYKVTSHALEIAKLTDGSFDPTLGPLVNLWGFGPGGERKIPKDEDIEKMKKRVGFQKILLLKKPFSIKKTMKGVYLDLSASAKGFAVDEVGRLLKKLSVKNFMVEIGGEILTSGKNKDKVWKVAMEAPHPEKLKKRFTHILPLENLAVATSGDYRNFFKEDNIVYSHAINSKTGRPVSHALTSVTVVDPKSCMRADSLATALMAMGPTKGLDFAKENNIAAFFVFWTKKNKEALFIEKASPKFKELFKRSE